MKKLKFVLAFVIGIIATSIFGACSCNKNSTISITSLIVDKSVVDVVVGEDFELTYTITPQAATNKKVYVEFPDGETYVKCKDGYVFDDKVSHTITFNAKDRKNQENDTEVRIKFTTSSGNYSATVKVVIHDTPTVLATPQNVKYEDGRVVWDAVDNAGLYYVYIDGKLFESKTNQYTPSLSYGSYHEIKVQAVADNIEFANSEESLPISIYPLATPAISTINNGEITWSPVANATHYQIEYATGKSVIVESNVTSYNIANILDQNSFAVKIKALYYFDVDGVPTLGEEGFVYEGVPTYIVSSAYSSSRIINRLAAPTNLKIINKSGSAITNGNLSWNTVSGATSYVVYINDGTKDYTITSKTNTADLTLFDGFDYSKGNYTVRVSAQGNVTSTISGEFSRSEEFSFTKMGYLTGTIDTTLDKLTISISDLIALGVSDDLLDALYFELTFVNSETTLTNNKNYTMTTSSREINLSDISGLVGGLYQKVVIRPYLNDNTVKTLANASKVIVVDTVDTYAGSFVKLPSTTINTISKDSVVNLNIDTTNVQNFVVKLTDSGDNGTSQTISKTASFVSIEDDNVEIDLTKLDLGFGTSDMIAGNYTLQVLPISEDYINSTPQSCTSFSFTKAQSVDSITLNAGVVSWQNIVGNFGYNVEFNGVETFYDINNFRPTTILDTNNLSITVLGNDTNVINSDTFISDPLYRASAITSYTLNQGVLNWQGEEGATYIVRYYIDSNFEKEETTSNNYYNSFTLSESSRITILKRVAGKFDSVEGAFIKLSQLSSVSSANTKIVDNGYRLAFDKIENNNGYQLDIVDAKGSLHKSVYTASDLTEYSESQWVVDLNTGYFTYGVNNVRITALGQTVDTIANETYYINSVPSTSLAVEVLPEVSAKVENGEFKWSISSSNTPQSYRFTITKDQITGATEDLVVDIPSVLKSGSYEWDELKSGDYIVSLQAFAQSGSNIINSPTSMISFEKIDNTSLNVKNGEIVFDGIEGAVGYKVYMYDKDDTLINDNVTANVSSNSGKVLVNLSNFNPNTEYKFAIKVLGGDKISSSLSAKRSVVKLDSVKNFSKTGNNLSWSNVEFNEGYVINGKNGFVYNQNLGEDVVTTTLANSSFENAGSYIVEIIALGTSTSGTSDTGYLNSEAVTLSIVKLNAPTKLTLSEGVLSWDPYVSITGAESPLYAKITAKLQGKPDEFVYTCEQGTSINLYEKADLEEGSYSLHVQFIGDNNLLIDSEIVDYKSGTFVSRISSANMTVNNGKIVFNKIANASQYRLYILSNQANSEYTLLDTTAYSIVQGDTTCEIIFEKDALTTGTNISLKLMTVAADNTDYINSNLSDELIINKLPAITDLSIGTYSGVSNRLIWTPVENASSYVIVIEGTATNYINVDGQSTCYYDIDALDLEVGSYTVKVYAKGSTTSGTGISYLSSELSNSTTIQFVTDKINIKSENGILVWNKVDGVQKYQIAISDGTDTQYRFVSSSEEIVTYNLDKDEFIDNPEKDYTVSVVPSSLDNAYYLIQTSEAVSIVVNRALEVYDLGISDGIITWKVDISDLSLEELAKAYEFFDKYKANPDAFEDSDEDYYVYEDLYPYWNFIITLNGTSYDIIPDKYTVVTNGLLPTAVQYYYEITDNVTSTQKYDIYVQSKGNNTCVDEEGNLIMDGSDPVATTYLPSIATDTLTAYKSTVPAGIVSRDGTIKFNLVTTVKDNAGTLVADYVKEYYLYAIPASPSAKSLQWQINVPEVSSDFAYTIDIKSLGDDISGEKILTNLAYTYKISTRGTFLGDLNSSEVLTLRSNFYSPVTITFLGDATIEYSSADTSLGGIIKWDKNTISTDITHTIYIMEESAAENLGNTWWKDANVKTIELASDEYYFSFDDDRAKEIGITGNTRYKVAVKYNGNGSTYVANNNNPNVINVTTLNAIEFGEENGNSVFIRNGKFTWTAVTNCVQYKITIYKLLASNNVQEIGPRYTSINEISCDNFDDGQAVVGYSLRIVPLGKERLVEGETVNFVNGFGNEPTSSSGIRLYFSQLPKVTGLKVVYQNNSNIVTWDQNDSARSYTVSINAMGTEETYNRYDAQYTIPSSWGPGTYEISVKYNSGNSNYLNGLYCSPITIKKMFEPQLHVEDGTVTWSSNKSETLSSSSTRVVVISCDANGNPNSVVSDVSQVITDPTISSYTLTGPAGYYLVSVQFLTQESGGGVYQLSSSESKIFVEKLEPVGQIVEGTYNGSDCNYSNYVKWKINEKAYAYKVELYNTQNQTYVGNANYYYVGEGNSGKNDPNMFALSTADNTYLCFNLQAMFNYKISTIEVQVSVIGNTTEYKETYENITETLGYITSETTSQEVSIPEASPNILSYDHGVIRWKGGAQYGETINNKDVTSTDSLAHNVEIVIVKATTFVFNNDSYTKSEENVEENTSFIWEYEEGKEEVFYCPYVTAGVYVKLRYFTSTFTSDFTPAFALTDNSLFYAGLGTEEQPYIIYHENNNNTELAKMFSNIQYRPTSNIAVLQDIDMSDQTWNQVSKFEGFVDGRGNTVFNLSVTNKVFDNSNYTAMFYSIEEDAKISDLTFENITVFANITNETQTLNMAALAINNNGLISNVKVTGSIYGYATESILMGGLVETNNGEISYCDVELNTKKSIAINALLTVETEGVHIHSNNKEVRMGGIACVNNGVINYSTVNSNIKALSTGTSYASYVGGIVYSNNYTREDSQIYVCTVKNTTNIEANNIGGVAFENNTNAKIGFSSVLANIKVVGYVQTGENKNSVISYFGGLVGRNKGYISSSYVYLGNAIVDYNSDGNSYFGGLVGYNDTNNTNIHTGAISNSYVMISTITYNAITPTSKVGSVVGYIASCENGDFDNIYVDTPITESIYSGGGGSNGDIDPAEISNVVYDENNEDNNLVLSYILSGIEVENSEITPQNEIDYNALEVKYIVNENYGLDGNTFGPYQIKVGNQIRA